MNPSSTTSAPRAFVLIVAVIAAVIVSAIVGFVLINTGQAQVATLHSTAGDQARGIAEAGMERTLSVLLANGARDFDDLLDPLAPGGSTCSCNLSTISGGTGTGVPQLTDVGATTVTHQGRSWRRVPYDGGAYLVRFEDDADDAADVDLWSSHTGNTGTNTGTGCGREGPVGTTNGSLANHLQNPCRDRNRSIWVNVIGIFPGTDPATAKHRATVRRLHTARLPTTVAGMQVRGNITVSGDGDLEACSPIGSIEADGALRSTGSGSACACGDSRAHDIDDVEHCTETTRCSSLTPPVACADGALAEEEIHVAALGNLDATGADGTDFYVDWSRPCVFFIDANDTLWSWDATATRGPSSSPLCSSLEGKGFGAPWPPNLGKVGSGSAADGDQWSGCWTPLIKEMTGACAPAAARKPDGTLTEQASTGVCRWLPIGNQSWTLTGAQISAAGFGGAPAGAVFNKPNWQGCRVLYPPFPTAAMPQVNLGCFNTATGGANCVDANSNGVGDNTALVGANGEVWFGAVDDASVDAAAALRNLEAVPAGVYIWNDTLVLSGSNFDFRDVLPGTKLPMSGYPLATVVMSSIDLNNRFWTGIGQAAGNPDGSGERYASLILDNNLTMRGGAEYRFAGSVYTRGSVNYQGNGSVTLHGELHSNNNFDLTGNGEFIWRYEVALQQTPTASMGPPTMWTVGE